MDGRCSLSNCNQSECGARAQFPVSFHFTNCTGNVSYCYIDYVQIALGFISFACTLLVFLSYWRIPRIQSSSQMPILAR